MTEHESDHDPATDPPGAVSDQNGEEGQSGLREDGNHPEPRTSGKPSSEDHQQHPTRGAAGEDAQSTGDRQNAA
jgi:hypothetical protein